MSGCNSSDRLFLQFISGSKASIFVRKTLQVFPCEIKKAKAFLSSQKRSAFFDEDDVCGRSQELRCSLSELYISMRGMTGALQTGLPQSGSPVALLLIIVGTPGTDYSSMTSTSSEASAGSSSGAATLASSSAALAAIASSAFFISIFASVSSLTPRYLRRPVPAGIS